MKKTSDNRTGKSLLRSKILIPLISLVLLLPTALFAYEAKTGASIFIPQDEVVEGSLYVAGQNITVEGTIKGDLICGAQSILINGQIDGDIICGAQSIVINGIIGGNLRIAAELITINGQVTRNANILGASIITSPGSSFGQDVLLAGAVTDISGNISGDLHGAASSLSLNGTVGKNVKFRFDDRIQENKNGFSYIESKPFFKIGKDATIGGNLYYKANKQAEIDTAAVIKGETSYSQFEQKKAQNSTPNFFWGWLYSIFTSLMIGLVLISLWRKNVLEIINIMSLNVWNAIGRGSLVVFLTPILLLLLMLTIIGIPLSLIVLALWIISFFIASLLTSIFVGQKIIANLSSNKETDTTQKEISLIWSMVIGVIVYQTITSLPVFGWIIALVAIWWGLGGMWLYFRKAE